MVKSIATDRPTAPWFRRDESLQVLELQGADVASWLAGQSTNDCVNLEIAQVQENAIVDRQGRLQASFWLARCEEKKFLALVPQACAEAFRSRLEQHLFREQVEIGPWQDWAVVHLEGSECRVRLLGLQQGCADLEFPGLGPVQTVEASEGSGEGFRLLLPPGSGDSAAKVLEGLGFDSMAPEDLERLQVEAGRARWGLELEPGILLPTTGLERRAVSYDKGCYVGQEVIARLRTYGAAKELLVGLRMPTEPQAGPGDLRRDGRPCGRLTGGVPERSGDGWLGLAYLNKASRVPGARFVVDRAGESLSVEVCWLPFVEPPDAKQLARHRYEEALDRFTEDLSDEDEEIIRLLEEALVFDPGFIDAHEVLGVVLQRHGRIAEAVERMEQLAELTPDAVMPHTNLSVLYMIQGRIEEAETEKAKATMLGFRQEMKGRKAEKLAAEERARLEADAERKVAMFSEVLDLDAEDALANFGLGGALMLLGRNGEAEGPLERAVSNDPDYSAAWLALGKAREFTGQVERAIAAYESGIAAAARRGDLQPLREMERRRDGLRVD